MESIVEGNSEDKLDMDAIQEEIDAASDNVLDEDILAKYR